MRHTLVSLEGVVFVTSEGIVGERVLFNMVNGSGMSVGGRLGIMWGNELDKVWVGVEICISGGGGRSGRSLERVSIC